MRTAEECAAKAAELERMAAGCALMQTRADYCLMADTWRWLAVQATWQDRFTAQEAFGGG